MTVEITEFEEIDPSEVHLVKRGANGFPPLLAKQVEEEVALAAAGEDLAAEAVKADTKDCPTCKGTGKIMDGKRDCPDCDNGKVATKAADYEALVKAKYNAEDLKAMADKGQAMPNADGDPSYPIADADDLDKAIKAVGRGGADHDAIRKHIMARAKALKLTSEIPDNWNADGSIAATKAAGATVPDDDGIPGSKTWEAADSARLNEAVQVLLDLQQLLTAAAGREEVEGQTVDPDDMMQAWTLQDACYMLTNLLGVVSAMAALEQREADMAPANPDGAEKSGKRLSGKSLTALTAARDHLNDLIGADDPSTETSSTDGGDATKGKDVEDMTKDELDQVLAARDEQLVTKMQELLNAAKAAPAATDETSDGTNDEEATKAAEANAATLGEVKDTVKSIAEMLPGVIARLATVEKMAAPGGPTKTRLPDALLKSEERDKLELQVADLERRANAAANDPELRKGYLERVNTAKAALAAL